jgi:hypothetical protein
MAAEVAAHWHRHYRAYVDLRVLNHQTVCFLRVAEGAALGRLIVGRKGQQTLFELSEDDTRAFMKGVHILALQFDADNDGTGPEESQGRDLGGYKPSANRRDRRVFTRNWWSSGVSPRSSLSLARPPQYCLLTIS